MNEELVTLSALKSRSVFVFGMGGGGDVIGAALIVQMLKDLNISNCYLGAIVWERYVVDPTPGPIPLEDMKNIDYIGSCSAIVNGDEYAIRSGMKVIFQAARLARVLKEQVYVIDISRGARGIEKGIMEIRQFLNVDAVIAVDVGGDVLAKGNEEGLWSPLADSVSLAGLLRARVDIKILSVLGLGADGELDISYLLKRIALIAKHKGLIGAIGINRREAYLIEFLLKKGLISETSSLILKAFNGAFGELHIRGGTRRVMVNPLMTIAWFIDINRVSHLFPLAQAVIDSSSIEEANEMLKKFKIVTELDIDKEIYKVSRRTGRITPHIVMKIREELMRKFKM